jgi:YD repeat-containing protein
MRNLNKLKFFILLCLVFVSTHTISGTYPATKYYTLDQQCASQNAPYQTNIVTQACNHAANRLVLCGFVSANVLTCDTWSTTQGLSAYMRLGFTNGTFGNQYVNIGSSYATCAPNSTISGQYPNQICTYTCDAPNVFDTIAGGCSAPLAPDFTVVSANKNSPGCSAPGTPWPIKYTTGNKVLTEQDYVFNSNAALTFGRYYNAQLNGGSRLGFNWLNDFQSQIVTTSTTSITGSQLVMVRANGLRLPFTYNGTAWLSDADVRDTLTELKNGGGTRIGWAYTVDATSEVENYNVTGKLFSISSRDGSVLTLTYSGAGTPVTIAPIGGLLITVMDSMGRSLNFTYDASNRISTMTNPEGGVYSYAYGTNNNLVSATYPDNAMKTYHYENASFPNALTGVTDENNSRYMTYTYDTNGRAVDEIAPSVGTNVNHYGLVYNPGVSTVVTDPLGTSRTYNFTTILGVIKSTGQNQPAGSGCAASAAALTYDANGNVASRIDFNGNKTAYVYDLTRNLETSRTEGLTSAGVATTATRTITTTWHATWRLPLVISEYTGATATGTALKKTTNTYDTKGNITSIAVNDPVRTLTRTTAITYTYSTAVLGLVLTKVVNGPRTDVTDTTTYTYYPHNATCVASTSSSTATNLGCRGQLQSIKNALNQTITFDRYNHHGQVEQMTDANGLVTINTYDLRQRLLSRTVGTETSSLVYDNAGQVTQFTMPDASTLNYTYDAAHRLTQIQDTLGNKVTYTLDAEGNRISENTYDPLGNLAKTITRSYDALNRLQTLTGVE